VRSIRALIAGVVVAAMAASCGSPSESEQGGVEINGVHDGAYRGAALPSSYRVPDVALSATDGKPFHLPGDLDTTATVLFFGYTHCPDICQLIMADITSAYLRLNAASQRQTRVLFVTTDPRRDTVPALRTYLARFDRSFVGLTGTLDDIKRAATALHVFVGDVKRLPTGGYDVAHGATVIGLRGERPVVAWTEGTPVNAMTSDISRLQKS
jgi:protein SCO1